MPKGNIVKKRGDEMLENDFDFQDFFQSPDNDEAIAGFMHGVIEASNNQMNLAIELTKLVVNKNPNNMREEDIFSTFKRASDVIANTTPLNGLLDELKASS